MAWKWRTTPVYPGADLDLVDTSYTPGTKEKDLYHSKESIPQKDFNRISEQTWGNQNYIIRPYSQSNWKPDVTKPQATKNSKFPSSY